MRTLIFSLLLLTFFSCSTSNNIKKNVTSDSQFLIKKIKTKNSWYVIYAIKKDTLYKIVSQWKEECKGEGDKILVGRFYDLELKSISDNAPIINGIKLKPVNYVGCYAYDYETEICLEPKKGIYDLHSSSKLKGLCYIN